MGDDHAVLVGSVVSSARSGVVLQTPTITTQAVLKSDGLINYYGRGSVSGTVKVNDQLSARRVTLFTRETMTKIESVMSNPTTGAYTFTGINEKLNYLIVADDYEQIYNAAVADWVTVAEGG